MPAVPATAGPASTTAQIKLPTFWPGQAAIWFVQVQFALKGIQDDDTRYNYVVAALDQATAERIVDLLAQLGWNLMLQGKGTDAEPVLRECVGIREKNDRDAWPRWDSVWMLGDALLLQEKYEDARSAFADVKKSCADCHKDFRVEEGGSF